MTNVLRILASVLVTCFVLTAFAADPPKEEEPFWAKGRPKDSETAMKMAPVPAYPIPTPADKLPIGKMKLSKGFKAQVWASGILDARALRLGDKGTVFVSSLFVAGKIYAVVDKGGKREVKTIAEKLFLPSGLEYYKGALYVATPKDITRYDDIENHLDNPPKPVMVYDKLPGDVPHGWKYLRVGPDGKLYFPVGAPCNICMPDEHHAQLQRINLDGSGMEVVAHGVRSVVGFDFDPRTHNLWFTENQRDWLSESIPNDKLNHLAKTGENFGFPYCDGGDIADPEFGWGHSCDEFTKPAAQLGAHTAPLGMKFYTGKMFPSKYHNAIFIARHGPWNRTQKYAADVVVAFVDAKGHVKKIEPFLTGLVDSKTNAYIGRPVDILQMKDGSLLVSDDHNGAIYRISYGK